MKAILSRLAARPVLSAQILLASLVVNLLGLATTIYTIQVLNRYVAHGVDATLTTLTIGVVMALIFEGAFRLVRQRLAVAAVAKAEAALDEEALDTLVGTRPDALAAVPPRGRRDLLGGPELIRQGLAPTVITSVLDVPFALLFVGVLALLSPPLALTASVFLVFALVLGFGLQALMRRQAWQGREASARRDALGGAALRVAETVRAFGLGTPVSAAWRVASAQSMAGRRHGVIWQGHGDALVRLLTGLMTVATTAVGAVLAVRGEITVGALIGANLLAGRAMMPLASLTRFAEPLLRARQARDGLDALKRLPRERGDGATMTSYTGAVQLQDLAVLYPGQPGPLFEGLTLDIAAGGVVGVVGGNGTGKTTLARLLCGLMEPARGSVLADGVDLRQLNPQWWRRQLVYLPQEPRFLAGTLGDAIRAGSPPPDPERMQALLREADLLSWVSGLKDGLSTPLMDEGLHLPLGVRRRLALARALCVDGPLVILDEPTEGLDGQGAAAVYAVMNRLHQEGRTIIAFSHDPNILRGSQVVIDLNSKPRPRIGRTATAPAATPAPSTPPASVSPPASAAAPLPAAPLPAANG